MRQALAFLTILPVGAKLRPPGRAGILAFPLVGLVLGAMWALVAWGAASAWGPGVAAAAVIAVDLVLTGALHLDAVADVADGWACRKPAAEALAVMRDPAIGAVGAAVLVAVMLARWSLIALLASQAHWWVLVVAPVVGRAAMVWLMSRSARAAGEPGTSLAEPLLAAGWGVVLGVAALTVLIAEVAGGPRGLVAVALAVIAAELALLWSRHRLGGVTGDVVGAAGILAELLALALLTAR